MRDITTHKLEQDRAISQQFSGNSEIAELKRELMKAQNEVDMGIDRESKLQIEIQELSKTRQDLAHDIEEIRRHKADMLEPQLIAATKELKVTSTDTDGFAAKKASSRKFAKRHRGKTKCL